ncbi:MAG: tetratricopeptide repeat protein, partial [Planctomycetes bacterium]|nr:tetratricopeptide repeat protein [Planctomycetota bacterium]
IEEALDCLTALRESVDELSLESEDRIELLTMNAWALSELGRHNEALDLLEPLVEDNPESARALATLGVVYSNAGDLEPACAALEEAARLDEKDETAIANLALVYERMRQYERSLELYEKAVDMGADIDWLLQRKAAVHTELGDLKSAKATLRRYLSLAPDDIGEWINLAILHSDDGEFDLAFQCYREAEKVAPDSGSLRLNWGVTAVRAGKLSQARQQLAYLDRLEPKGARRHLLRAFIAEEEEQFDAARSEYETALTRVKTEENGDIACALELYMDFASRQGDRARCESLFATAYAENACTVELCEAYREAQGEPVEQATWFSLAIEADYRPGLYEVPDRDQKPGDDFTRYMRNFQVIAADRDDALAIVMQIMSRMGEAGVSVREFVGSEPVKDSYIGIYEIDREALVYLPTPG